MKFLFASLASLIFSLSALATEHSYFYCTSQTKFAAVKVTQVLFSENGTTYSTFKLDVWNLQSEKSEYWQISNVQISSNNTFSGIFERENEIPVEAVIKAPSFPDYRPQESWINQGDESYALDCHKL